MGIWVSLTVLITFFLKQKETPFFRKQVRTDNTVGPSLYLKDWYKKRTQALFGSLCWSLPLICKGWSPSWCTPEPREQRLKGCEGRDAHLGTQISLAGACRTHSPQLKECFYILLAGSFRSWQIGDSSERQSDRDKDDWTPVGLTGICLPLKNCKCF